MDDTPFFELDITSFSEKDLLALLNFCKDGFSVDNIVNNAEELRQIKLVKEMFHNALNDPYNAGDFLYFFKDVFLRKDEVKFNENKKKQAAPVVKKAINQYLEEKMDQRLRNALSENQPKE